MAEILNDSIDFLVYLKETDAQTNVRPASSWIDSMKASLRAHTSEKKVFLPWQKTNDNFMFRKGEVTLWSGQNGHGKSLMTGQIALSLLGQDERVCVASFEMKPAATLHRMARQFSSFNPYATEFSNEEAMAILDDVFDEFGSWTDGRLWLYDQQGTANTEMVIGMARYCAKELGIGHIFIDNLAKCVRGEDDYNGQKSFVDELTALARDCDCHIHLVHHLKKPANENAVPDKHDNKGSGSITDQVDNVMMVFRNKAKEDDVKSKGLMSKHASEPDQYLLCRKQRNYSGSVDGEPSIKLWFNRESQQYLANDNDAPLFFANYPHRKTGQ